MKMTAASYLFHSQSTSFVLSSLSLIYFLFHECYLLAIISMRSFLIKNLMRVKLLLLIN